MAELDYDYHRSGIAAARSRGPVRAYRDHQHHHGHPYAPEYETPTAGHDPAYGVAGGYPAHAAAPYADPYADPYGGAGAAPDDIAATQPGSIGMLVNWAGALVSLGLVVGMGVWAWQLTTRDVSGVPVIQALEGPMRVAPDDPGGAQAPNQGLSVNRIAEGQEAAPAPDRVVLAPPPVDLDGVPVPRPVDAEAVAEANAALIDRLLSSGAPLDAVTDPAAAAGSSSDPAVDPAPAAPEAGQSPEAGAAPEDAITTAVAEALESGAIPASVPGVARSLRPVPRPVQSAPAQPATGAAPAPAAESPAPDVDGVTEIAPADLPAGTRLVQLGAFDTETIARSEWDRLTTRFPDFMAGRARVIEQASSGGAVFYRLRAHGFDDLPAARRFCTALVAQGAACIPVTVR